MVLIKIEKGNNHGHISLSRIPIGTRVGFATDAAAGLTIIKVS